jgi:hypothetical protein
VAWLITANGQTLHSDDMTLGELGEAEERTGQPWSLLNPWTSIATAQAFMRIALARQGLAGAELDAAVGALTARDVKAAFDFVADEPIGAGDGQGAAEGGDPLDRSSQSSSGGARAAGAGAHPKRAKNG